MSETVRLPRAEAGPGELQTIVPGFESVAGWLTEEEAEELFRLASGVQSGCIVEIGSYRGRSTLALCAGSSIGAKVPVYAIDPHEESKGLRGGKFGPRDRAVFFKNFSKTDLVRYVRLLNTTSQIAASGWQEPITLIFIDGDHSYASVHADFAAWRPHLAPDATVVFHDIDLVGPKRVIDQLLGDGTLTFVSRVCTIGAYRLQGNPVQGRSPKPGERAVRGRKPPAGIARAPRGGKHSQYKVGWEHIGFSVYYGGGGAYLYQPIPKCACTTIKTLLLELEGLPAIEDTWRRHQKIHNNFPGTANLSNQEQLDIFEGRTDTFKFVIVRNPYARLASVYLDKFLKLSDSYWIGQIREAAHRQGISLSDEITFEEFVGVVARQSYGEMDPHWRPQFFEGRFETIKFDFVGRMETMPDDLIYALDRIGAPEHIVQRATERYNSTGSDLAIWEAVSPALRKLYLDKFAVDFEVLQYHRRLPGWRSPPAIGPAKKTAALAAA